MKSACPTDSTTSTNEPQGEMARQRLAATKASKMPEWEEMMFFGRGTCLRLCECQDHDIHAYMLPYRTVILHRHPSSSLAPERRRERPVRVLARILLPVLFALRGCRNAVVIVWCASGWGVSSHLIRYLNRLACSGGCPAKESSPSSSAPRSRWTAAILQYTIPLPIGSA